MYEEPHHSSTQRQEPSRELKAPCPEEGVWVWGLKGMLAYQTQETLMVGRIYYLDFQFEWMPKIHIAKTLVRCIFKLGVVFNVSKLEVDRLIGMSY